MQQVVIQQDAKVSRRIFNVGLLQCKGERYTSRWCKDRAFCPALPDVLPFRDRVAEQDIAQAQQAHTIQVEVNLHREAVHPHMRL